MKHIVENTPGPNQRHLQESASLLKEKSDGKTEKPAKTLLDLPNELMHLIMRALNPEGTISVHCWTIKALLDVDWLGAMGADKEVVKALHGLRTLSRDSENASRRFFVLIDASKSREPQKGR